MKFKNKETGTIIEVDKKNVVRIEKLKGYPDKFEVVEEKKDDKNTSKKDDKNTSKTNE